MTKFAYILLLVFVGCATRPLSFEQNPAHEVLANAAVAASYPAEREVLEFKEVGIAGTESRGFIAYSSIMRSAQARRYFVRLVRRGNIVGKIYGLIGLNQVDPAAYARLEPVVLSNHGTDHVRVFIGCVGQSRTVSEILTGYPNWPLPVRDGSWSREYASGSSASRPGV